MATAISHPDISHTGQIFFFAIYFAFSCSFLFRKISPILLSFCLSIFPLICLHIQVTKDILGVFNCLLTGNFCSFVPLRVHGIKS